MFLNLKLIQQRDNLLGLAIVRNYKKDPAKILDMIQDHFKHDPVLVMETLGSENTQALGLLNPLEKFMYYFPVKGATYGLSGILVYRVDTKEQLLACVVRAKVMIADLRLPLLVRSDTQFKKFRFYIEVIPRHEIPQNQS